MLERSYIQQLFKVVEKVNFEQMQVEQTILLEQAEQLVVGCKEKVSIQSSS